MKVFMIIFLGLGHALASNIMTDNPLEYQCRNILFTNYNSVPHTMLRKCRRVERLAQYKCIEAIANHYSSFPKAIMNECLNYRSLFASDALLSIAEKGFNPLYLSIVKQVGQTQSPQEYLCIKQYVQNSSTINAHEIRRLCF